MITCEERQREAAGIATLAPDEPERRAAFEHARACPACARALREAERVLALVDSIPPPNAPSHEALLRASAEILADLDGGAHTLRLARPRGGRALLPAATGLAWLLLVAIAKERAPDTGSWVASALVVAIAVVGAAAVLARSVAVVIGAALVSAGFASWSGDGGALFVAIGLKCTAIELIAGAAPLAAAAWVALRGRLAAPATSFAAVAATGALAGHAALHLSCPVRHAEPHLFAFHLGGVFLAAVMGLALARTRRLALPLAALLASCGLDTGHPGAGGAVAHQTDAGMISSDGVDGESVYARPIAGGNTFTCATCHALEEPALDGLVRPGHPLGDATRRPSYKRGRVREMREAVNNCLAHWMNAEPWSADDPRWRALHGWLDAHAHARERAYALEYEIVPPASELSGGDAERGRDVFNGRCVVCHGEDGAGTGRAPRVAGLGLPGDYVARRVRTSGAKDNPIYDELTGGVMPFWAKDRLSDSQLRDIVAFLALLGADAGVDAGGGTSVDAGAGSGQACAATHAKVGDRAEFVMEFHGVGGTATVVDDCTIEISDFAYDGNGIDVRIYGGLGGDYHGGFAMSDDLLKPGGYLGETIQAVLPVDKTLDDLDGLSVWCVDVGVSFGEARF